MQTRFSATPSISEKAIKSIKPVQAGLAYCEDGSIWVVPLSRKGNLMHDTKGDIHTLIKLEEGDSDKRRMSAIIADASNSNHGLTQVKDGVDFPKGIRWLFGIEKER